MKLLLVTLLLIVSTPSFSFGGKDYNESYAPDRNPFIDFKQVRADAHSSNTQVLIVLGGDWCPWCHQLSLTINENPELREQLDNTFTVMKVGVNEKNNTEIKDFIKTLPTAKGYPFLVIVDIKGNVIGTQNTVHLKTGKDYSPQKIMGFFRKWKMVTAEIPST